MSVIQDIEAERLRQVMRGYTPQHDDAHDNGQLAYEAECVLVGIGDDWGILKKWHKDRRKQLIIAAALIVAEVERMDRKGGEA